MSRRFQACLVFYKPPSRMPGFSGSWSRSLWETGPGRSRTFTNHPLFPCATACSRADDLRGSSSSLILLYTSSALCWVSVLWLVNSAGRQTERSDNGMFRNVLTWATRAIVHCYSHHNQSPTVPTDISLGIDMDTYMMLLYVVFDACVSW